MELTHTANGKYEYECIHNGKTLDKWIEEINRHNCAENKWNYFQLRKGNFGYDNLAVCISYVFKYIKKRDKLPTLKRCCELIHNGWIENYTHWRDNKPYNGNSGYKRPGNPLDDERRNNCARLSFDELPDDEKTKDEIIAKYLLQNIILNKKSKNTSSDSDNEKKTSESDNKKIKKQRNQ